MQDYEPKWSADVVLNYLMDISDTAKVLNICLEQIVNDPPDLIPRLYWLLYNIQKELECCSDDGLFHAKNLRNHLNQSEPGEVDESDRPIAG